LLVSIGDGGNPPVRLGGAWIRDQAQNRCSHLGKILRLNDDGSIPRNNPFSRQLARHSIARTSTHLSKDRSIDFCLL
jgi:glucose/arabinose dehydrogenase